GQLYAQVPEQRPRLSRKTSPTPKPKPHAARQTSRPTAGRRPQTILSIGANLSPAATRMPLDSQALQLRPFNASLSRPSPRTGRTNPNRQPPHPVGRLLPGTSQL